MSTSSTIYHQETIHIYDELLENAVYLEVSNADVEIRVRLMNSNELLSESRKALRLLSEGAKIRAAQLLHAPVHRGQSGDLQEKGLFNKYKIGKTDGTPMEPEAEYFVLRVDTDEEYYAEQERAAQQSMQPSEGGQLEADVKRLVQEFLDVYDNFDPDALREVYFKFVQLRSDIDRVWQMPPIGG